MSTAVVIPPPATVDVPKQGFGTKLAYVLVVLAAVPALLDGIFDLNTGIPPYVSVYAASAVAIALVLGRGVQAVLAMVKAKQATDPRLGPSSIVALVITGLEYLPILFQDLAEASNPLNVDPSVWAKAGTAVAVALLVSRFVQGAITAYNAAPAVPGPSPAPGPVTPPENPETPVDPVPAEPAPTENDPTAPDLGDGGESGGLPRG